MFADAFSMGSFSTRPFAAYSSPFQLGGNVWSENLVHSIADGPTNAATSMNGASSNSFSAQHQYDEARNTFNNQPDQNSKSESFMKFNQTPLPLLGSDLGRKRTRRNLISDDNSLDEILGQSNFPVIFPLKINFLSLNLYSNVEIDES